MTTIRCPKLHATLTEESCGRRHRIANHRGVILAVKMDQDAREALRCSPCRTCEIGAENAKKHRLPEQKQRKNRVCSVCETSFVPLSWNGMYCSVTCSREAAARAAKERHED